MHRTTGWRIVPSPRGARAPPRLLRHRGNAIEQRLTRMSLGDARGLRFQVHCGRHLVALRGQHAQARLGVHPMTAAYTLLFAMRKATF